MTYPSSGSGYPSAQPPGSYGTPAPEAAPAAGGGESQLPMYLTIAVAVLGLAAYLTSFGPMYDTDSPLGSVSVSGSMPTTAAMLAGLLAGVGLLPKGKSYAPVVAVLALLGALLAIAKLFDAPEEASIGWGLWLVLVCTLIQAAIAIGVLLLEAGVITPPAPKPAYDPYQYGGYYGQPGQAQQPGYGSQYGGGYPSAPAAPPAPAAPAAGGYPSAPGGYPSAAGAQQEQTQQVPQQSPPQGAHHGPPTPPTGFPSFSPPPGSEGAGPGQPSYGGPQGPSGPPQP